MPKIIGTYGISPKAGEGPQSFTSPDSPYYHYRGEGWQLPASLDAAVPLWQMEFARLSSEKRQEVLDEAVKDDLCLRMEYLLHRGPKKGDTARAFNDVARSLAVLSFYPGGITLFGRHWDGNKLAEALASRGEV